MMLITLQEASDHLRRDTADDDADLLEQIEAASGAVLNYLKGAPIGQPQRDEQGRVMLDEEGHTVYLRDSDDALIVRAEVKHAVKILLGYLFRDRDAEEQDALELGFLPKPVISLLTPLRDPACQ